MPGHNNSGPSWCLVHHTQQPVQVCYLLACSAVQFNHPVIHMYDLWAKYLEELTWMSAVWTGKEETLDVSGGTGCLSDRYCAWCIVGTVLTGLVVIWMFRYSVPVQVMKVAERKEQPSSVQSWQSSPTILRPVDCIVPKVEKIMH